MRYTHEGLDPIQVHDAVPHIRYACNRRRLPWLSRCLCSLEAYLVAHVLYLHLSRLSQMTMLTGHLFLFLSILFLNSVYADLIVYPRIPSNLRLNAAITDSIVSLLGAENVQTFISGPRQVYEFWLIRATNSQVAIVKGMVGVSISMTKWDGTSWVPDDNSIVLGRGSTRE